MRYFKCFLIHLTHFTGASSTQFNLVLTTFMCLIKPFGAGLKGLIPVNPMAEKLLLIKSLGYLLNDIRWKGFRIHEERGILITPEDREFSPKELDTFVYWRDEYRQLVELHGRIDNPIKQPAKENLQPFRGGDRSKAAPWIPSKHKFK